MPLPDPPCCLQACVSRARVESFSLIADMMYMATNSPRILRAVFEIALRWVHAWLLVRTAGARCSRGWPSSPSTGCTGGQSKEVLMLLECVACCMRLKH